MTIDRSTIGKIVVVAMTCAAISAVRAYAQFTPGILANDSYWADGKAEFDIYDAELIRAGQPRRCEVLHIFVRERIDPSTFARVDDAKNTGAVRAIRMQQIWTAPLGLFVEQGSVVAYWRLDPLLLAQLSFTGTDSFGNVVRRVEQKHEGTTITWSFSDNNSIAPAAGSPLSLPEGVVFYDELPLSVRTIDFRQSPREFEVPLAPSLAMIAKGEEVRTATAKISWKNMDKSIEVTVRHAQGSDRFLLDREFPFLLRQWNAADGSKLKMKRGLKADYWNYNKNGDRERALKDPMLEHPD